MIKISNGKVKKDSIEYIRDKVDNNRSNLEYGHYKTNFSIFQKENVEICNNEAQQMFQMIPFGTKFESTPELDLRTVDTFFITPDELVNKQVQYTGTWTNDDSANWYYGRAKGSTVKGDYSVISFTGVAVFIEHQIASGGVNFIQVELSVDNGITWTNKKSITTGGSVILYNNLTELYSGLDYGDYKVKITLMNNTPFVLTRICYTAYCIQHPAYPYYKQASPTISIENQPPLSILLTGTWTNYLNSSINCWNYLMNHSVTNGDTLEFRFYGSKIWINSQLWPSSPTNIGLLIDGVTTYCLASSISLYQPNNSSPCSIRLDNGLLAEGWHTVKITVASAGQFILNGFSYYSSVRDSTTCRSLICGAQSYAIGVDDPSIAYTGTWNGIVSFALSFLRRRDYSSVNGSYLTLQTPNNTSLKAIYVISDLGTAAARGIMKVTLGGSKIRYIDQRTAFVTEVSSLIYLLYDSNHDGDLYDQQLKIENFSASNTIIEGFIFEIGDPSEEDYVWCMPKWTRYHNTQNVKTISSNTQRLDVYGIKSDKSRGNLPVIHSSWLYKPSSGYAYWQHGIGFDIMNAMINIKHNSYYESDREQTLTNLEYNSDNPLGVSIGNADANIRIVRLLAHLNRVV